MNSIISFVPFKINIIFVISIRSKNITVLNIVYNMPDRCIMSGHEKQPDDTWPHSVTSSTCDSLRCDEELPPSPIDSIAVGGSPHAPALTPPPVLPLLPPPSSTAAALDCDIIAKKMSFTLTDELGNEVDLPPPIEGDNVQCLSPSLLASPQFDWCYSDSSDTGIVDVHFNPEDNKPVKGEQSAEGGGEGVRVCVRDSECQQSSSGLDGVNFLISNNLPGSCEIDEPMSKKRRRISSCSICFEHEHMPHSHTNEEVELVLLCFLHNKINCFKYQFVIYLPKHGYISFLEMESEADMSFLVKCYHAVVSKFHLDLNFAGEKSRFFRSPTDILCNSSDTDTIAMPKMHYVFIRKIRSFFVKYLQRLLKRMALTNLDILFKRFAFYSYSNEISVKENGDKRVMYEKITNAEIAFMKCERVLCSTSLFPLQTLTEQKREHE